MRAMTLLLLLSGCAADGGPPDMCFLGNLAEKPPCAAHLERRAAWLAREPVIEDAPEPEFRINPYVARRVAAGMLMPTRGGTFGEAMANGFGYAPPQPVVTSCSPNLAMPGAFICSSQ